MTTLDEVPAEKKEVDVPMKSLDEIIQSENKAKWGRGRGRGGRRRRGRGGYRGPFPPMMNPQMMQAMMNGPPGAFMQQMMRMSQGGQNQSRKPNPVSLFMEVLQKHQVANPEFVTTGVEEEEGVTTKKFNTECEVDLSKIKGEEPGTTVMKKNAVCDSKKGSKAACCQAFLDEDFMKEQVSTLKKRKRSAAGGFNQAFGKMMGMFPPAFGPPKKRRKKKNLRKLVEQYAEDMGNPLESVDSTEETEDGKTLHVVKILYGGEEKGEAKSRNRRTAEIVAYSKTFKIMRDEIREHNKQKEEAKEEMKTEETVEVDEE